MRAVILSECYIFYTSPWGAEAEKSDDDTMMDEDWCSLLYYFQPILYSSWDIHTPMSICIVFEIRSDFTSHLSLSPSAQNQPPL